MRHQLFDGVLLRDGKPPLSYLDFVRMAARVGNPILALLNVLKMFCIMGHTPATASRPR